MQDFLPENGMENLIALPCQGQAMRNGNTLFVDEQWRPQRDQYKALTEVHRLSLQKVDACIGEWCPDNNPYGKLQEDEEEPKERELLRNQMAAVPKDETMLAVAIGQYIGEGVQLSKTGYASAGDACPVFRNGTPILAVS